MSSKTLTINNNINNEQQYCKGCERTFPSSSFTTNGKSQYTVCRIQNREVHQRKIMPEVDQILIEFSDFEDFMAGLFEEDDENKENLEFKLSCTVEITTLKIEDNLKEWVERIVKIMSDVHGYIMTFEVPTNPTNQQLIGIIALKEVV